MRTPWPKPNRAQRVTTALRRNDPDALQLLASEYGSVVFGYLVSTIGDRGDAEDVYQQVLLEAWQRRNGYEPGRGELHTWLMTIARSRAIDHLRRRRPEPRDPQEPEPAGNPADRDLEDDVVERWRVAQLLTRIPAEEAKLLRMRFYEELTQPEIATRTGIPLGTVKMRMVQALERLHTLLDQEEWR